MKPFGPWIIRLCSQPKQCQPVLLCQRLSHAHKATVNDNLIAVSWLDRSTELKYCSKDKERTLT